MREMIPLNRDWLYARDLPKDGTPSFEGTEGKCVELPHANVLLPYNYLDERAYQFVSGYQRMLFASEEWRHKRVFLHFEGVMAYAEVFCNGHLAGHHKGGYTPFTVEITKYLRCEEENSIFVRVDSTERPDFPPCGNVVDYLTYGGIYREMSLEVVEKDFIRTLFVSPQKAENGEEARAAISFDSPLSKETELRVFLKGHGTEKSICMTLKEGALSAEAVFDGAENLRHWSPEDPALYEVTAELWQDGKKTDELHTRFGMRFCKFKPDGFYLNGRRMKLLGLNRHQSYPYVGGAMPARVQRHDAECVKELGMNIVRTSHYPQSRHFLDRCDEIGLLVFEEIPGWQHIGNPEWQDVAVQSVREMIERDYNHPAIILWGVRINESHDSYDFYARTNALAHKLDSTRQTGGVRCHVKGDFQEDVFTFNEFIHGGGELIFRPREDITGRKEPVPLLVTESNGHMFPTKRFDTESRLLEHAMRHLRVMNEALGRDDLVGEISWCAFDYNTYGAFGSGDKICYHGVSDMFRIPKYAGLALMSQHPVAQGAVLEPLSVVSRGERDGGGILPVWLATNCDCVRVYKNGALVGDFYPNRTLFKNLPHPPVLISHLMPAELELPIPAPLAEEFKGFVKKRADEGILQDLLPEDYPYLEALSEKAGLERGKLTEILFNNAGGWGQKENILRLEGYVGEKAVIVREVGEAASFARLELKADDDTLTADGDTYDATRIVVRALDTMGNLCPFYAAGFSVRTNGLVEVIGPKSAALIGGCLAFWVKTCGKKGKAEIRLDSGSETQEISINII